MAQQEMSVGHSPRCASTIRRKCLEFGIAIHDARAGLSTILQMPKCHRESGGNYEQDG